MRRTFRTGDGVSLSYVDEGTGPPLILLHGWSQCAEEFKFQIADLNADFRVLALDFRGHGQSGTPDYGYRVARLAQDLSEFLDHLALEKAALLGHSLGCSVIWSYLAQHGTERLDKLIFVDEPTCLAVNPAWTAEKCAAMGAVFKPDTAFEVANRLRGPDGAEFTKEMLFGMFTEGVDPELKDWVIRCNLQFPRHHAANLLLDNIFSNWQDILSRIDLPTLVIGGEASVTPAAATRHVAGSIPGSRLEIFGASEGGSHFMFLENPTRFNALVRDFITP